MLSFCFFFFLKKIVINNILSAWERRVSWYIQAPTPTNSDGNYKRKREKEKTSLFFLLGISQPYAVFLLFLLFPLFSLFHSLLLRTTHPRRGASKEESMVVRTRICAGHASECAVRRQGAQVGVRRPCVGSARTVREVDINQDTTSRDQVTRLCNSEQVALMRSSSEKTTTRSASMLRR